MLTERWGHQIARRLNRDIHGIYGCDVRQVIDDQGVAGYVSKIHFELARADLKARDDGISRTPWQVAVDGIRWGDKADIARWAEFVTATKGKRIYSRSECLIDRYGKAGSEDATDDELAGRHHRHHR